MGPNASKRSKCNVKACMQTQTDRQTETNRVKGAEKNQCRIEGLRVKKATGSKVGNFENGSLETSTFRVGGTKERERETGK